MYFPKKLFRFLSHLSVIIFIIGLFLFDFSSLDRPASLAQSPDEVKLYLQSSSPTVTKGDTFMMEILLDTNGQSFNAVQAEIAYPASLLSLVTIDTASSAFGADMLNFGAEGKVSIVRGSFTPVTGNGLVVAKLTFKAADSGQAELAFQTDSAVVNSQTNSLTSSPGLVIIINPSLPLPSASVLPSASPITTSSRLAIYAAGTQVANIYPTLKLQVQNPKTKRWEDKKSFTNVRGNPSDRTFVKFIYTHPTKLNLEQIRLVFTNDKYLPKQNQDRNLRIDKIILDGIDYQTEHPQTFSTGSWNSETGCQAGNKSSEWLQCNGYFQFR